MRLSENNLPKEQQVFICCDLFRRSEPQPHSDNKYCRGKLPEQGKVNLKKNNVFQSCAQSINCRE